MISSEIKDVYLSNAGFKIIEMQLDDIQETYSGRFGFCTWKSKIVHLSFQGRTKSFHFRCGMLHGEFTISTALEVLFSDSDHVEQYDCPKAFAEDYGFDANEDSNKNMFEEMKRNTKKLRALLGESFEIVSSVIFDEEYNFEEELV